MSSYVIDAYAWIEYFEGSEKGRRVKDILEGDAEVFTCAVTFSEVVSKFLRRNKDASIAIQAITVLSNIVAADAELAVSAAEVHAAMKRNIPSFGLADAFVLACAKAKSAKIVSGDTHFETVKGVVML